MAQLIELVGLAFQAGVVGLVGHANHRHLHITEPFGDLAVQRRDAFAGIDDEEDHRRRINGRLNLFFDVLGQVVDVLDAHAAGIDQFDESFAELRKVRDAIAGHAGLRIDDGQPLAGKPVEKTRLAHIGPAHDGDLRNTHDLDSVFLRKRRRGLTDAERDLFRLPENGINSVLRRRFCSSSVVGGTSIPKQSA